MSLEEQLQILNKEGQMWHEYAEKRAEYEKLEETAQQRFQSLMRSSPKLKKLYYNQFNPKPL